jgi:hypothetical protein
MPRMPGTELAPGRITSFRRREQGTTRYKNGGIARLLYAERAEKKKSGHLDVHSVAHLEGTQ